MSSNEVFAIIADIFMATFEIIKAGNNYVNWFFIVIIFIALVVWMFMQAKYNKEEMTKYGSLK